MLDIPETTRNESFHSEPASKSLEQDSYGFQAGQRELVFSLLKGNHEAGGSRLAQLLKNMSSLLPLESRV